MVRGSGTTIIPVYKKVVVLPFLDRLSDIGSKTELAIIPAGAML